MDSPEGFATPPAPSPAALDVYRRIGSGESIPPDSTGLQELQRLHLVTLNPHTEGGRWVLLDAEEAARRVVHDMLDGLTARAQYARQVHAQFQALEQSVGCSGGVQRRASGSERLDTVDAINDRLAWAVATSTRFAWTAQPGPRPKESLRISMDRDAKMVERGVSLRTIYHKSRRTDPNLREWAEHMSALGAEVRLAAFPFRRLIVVDDNAFIPTLPPAPERSAWHVTDPAMIDFLKQAYEDTWSRAEPWADNLGAPAIDSPSMTDPMQRNILHLLSRGHSNAQIAKKLGVSGRWITTKLGELRTALGVQTTEELTFWWATSPDRTDHEDYG